MQIFFFAILLKDLKIYVEFTDHIGIKYGFNYII